MTLYEKYGGFAQIHKIVMDFYERLLDNGTLGPFFENTDLRKLIDHQTEFIAGAMGGPAKITDARLTAAHANLELTHDHFNELLVVLRATLEDAGVEEIDIQALVDGIESKRSIVIS